MSTITIELDDDTLASIRQIVDPDDDGDIARFIADYLATHLGPHPDFTPEQIAAIEAGLENIRLGKVVPHDEVFEKLEARYRK